MPTLPRVLIVEDDPAIRTMLIAALGREALSVDSAPDGVAALEKLAIAPFSVIIVDLMMPRMDGYAFLNALRELRPPVRPLIFVMTAYDDAALLKLDPTIVHGCLKKPFDVERVVEMIRDAAALLHRAGQAEAATDALPPEIAGESC